MNWDRAAHFRTNAEWLEKARAAENAKLIPVWRNRNLIEAGRPPVPVWLRAEEHSTLLDRDAPTIFLGLSGGAPVFAIDLSADDDSRAFGLPGRFEDLRRAGAFMSAADIAPLAYARGMCRWHRVTRFCDHCGGPLEAREAGFSRACRTCDHIVYPRTDPAVMVLITRGDECLLARQSKFPPGMFSALAGFVEPGESLEECVARETKEEVGLQVGDIRYVGSQPWPFPASLMLGFRAVSDESMIRLDDEELEDARWFSREELVSPKGFFHPPPMSLAYTLIAGFVAEA